MSQQHYRMTLSEAIAQYQCGLISATALLYYYLKIRLKQGWKVTLHQREISQELGISKAAFYKGISRLKEKNLINWEAPNGLVVSLGQNGDSLDRSETPLDRSETPLDRSETPLDRSETATPVKPLSDKESSDSPNYYHIFINSLSMSQREIFLKFVNDKIKHFPTPINDLEGWLARKNEAGQPRFQVYYNLFTNGDKADNPIKRDWENHPKREEWISQIRLGKPQFIARGGTPEEQPVRKAFADWAISHNLV